MALPDYFQVEAGTTITFKSSGGDYAITMTSVANGAARQAVKADLGALHAELYELCWDVEMAATPTAGSTIDFHWGPSANATAGTDNPGNTSGTDAAYAGYSSNMDASLPQLDFLGSAVVTAQATATVQKGKIGPFRMSALRYGNLVVVNRTGAAFHSSATNIQFRLVPVKASVQD